MVGNPSSNREWKDDYVFVVGTIGKVFPGRGTRILLVSVKNRAYLRLLVCVCSLVLFIRCFGGL